MLSAMLQMLLPEEMDIDLLVLPFHEGSLRLSNPLLLTAIISIISKARKTLPTSAWKKLAVYATRPSLTFPLRHA